MAHKRYDVIDLEMRAKKRHDWFKKGHGLVEDGFTAPEGQ